MPSTPHRPRSATGSDAPARQAGDRPVHRLGLVADPGTPWSLVRHISADLAGTLDERVPGESRWEVEPVEASLPLDEETGHILEAPAREMADEHGWDTVVAVVDLPRFEGGHGVVADVLPLRRIAVVCVPALGITAPRRRLRETLVRVVEHLDRQPPRADPPDGELDVEHAEEEGIRVDAPHGSATEDARLEELQELTPMGGTDVSRGPAPVDASRDREASTVYVRGGWGTVRLLAGMVMANRPMNLLRNMTWSVASASAAGAYGVFFGSIWALSNEMSVLRLLLVMALSLVLLVGWLIVTNGLWAWDRDRVQRSALDNVSTILTVGIACTVVYALLFATLGVVAGVIIPPGYLSRELEGHADPSDYLQLVWLATSMGTMAGAVGSSFDDTDRIRTATYSLRELHRRRLGRDARKERREREEAARGE